MLEDFQLAAIVGDRKGTQLLRVPLGKELQQLLAESWWDQYKQFVERVDEVKFDAGYTPDDHERFFLPNYELPDWLMKQNRQSVSLLDTITKNDTVLDAIKGLVAFACERRGEELMLFQNFNRSHVIQPGLFLLLDKDTYGTARRPGMTLQSKLSAVFLPVENKLLFHNFRVVNTFLPLASFYDEASELQIRKILGHRSLAPEDVDALATNTNQWFRKRFAMLRDSETLDQYTTQQIIGQSNSCDIDIQVVDERIVFPSDKKQAKRLLQFLNEEIYRGAITDTLFETNSKRKANL